MAVGVRQNRVAQVISRNISVLLLQEFGGTPLGFVTIQRVKISTDLRVATLYYTVFGDESRVRIAELFEKHSRFLRGQIGKQLKHLRSIPELRFVHDDASEEMMRLEKIFDDAKRERREKGEDEQSEDE